MYLKLDSEWVEAECKKCRTPAVGHQWGFSQLEPPAGQEDTRQKQDAVGEVFIHADGRECVMFFHHEHDYSKLTEKDGKPGYECKCGAFQPLGLARQ